MNNVKRNYRRPIINRKEKEDYKIRKVKIEKYPSLLELLKMKTYSELDITPW